MPDDVSAKGMAFIQSHEEAMKLSLLIIDELCGIDGYAAIPDRIQTAIEQKCAQLYAAGFIYGMRHAKEIE